MSRESKILNAASWGAEKTIYHYESFGWELLSLNGNQITMTRETQNPVYADLVKYQAKYEQLLRDYQNVRDPLAPAKLPEFNFGTCALLLLLCIVPGALYIAYRFKKKREYEAAVADYKNGVAACSKKRADILAEIDQLLMDSRATFFGRQ